MSHLNCLLYKVVNSQTVLVPVTVEFLVWEYTRTLCLRCQEGKTGPSSVLPSEKWHIPTPKHLLLMTTQPQCLPPALRGDSPRVVLTGAVSRDVAGSDLEPAQDQGCWE